MESLSHTEPLPDFSQHDNAPLLLKVAIKTVRGLSRPYYCRLRKASTSAANRAGWSYMMKCFACGISTSLLPGRVA